MEKVFVNPKKKDLFIVGEFMSLEVHYCSFEVRYQTIIPNTNFEEQYLVQKRIYPLKFLKEFFRVNGKNKLVFCKRVGDSHWNMT